MSGISAECTGCHPRDVDTGASVVVSVTVVVDIAVVVFVGVELTP